MVPNQHFDKPGKSPFMNMQLVPKYPEGNETAASVGVRIDPGIVQNLGVRLTTVTRGRLTQPVEAVGSVTFDEREIAVVQARAGGFVSRVYARAPGDVVSAGSPLVDVLIPDWAGAQAEFLTLLQRQDPALISAARQRLVLLGMPEDLIAELDSQHQPRTTVTIRAPHAGVIDALDIRQGMTVTAGATLARINGLGQVWVEAAIPEAQASTANIGRAVQVSLNAYPGEQFEGRVVALLPQANTETRTLRLRVELANPGGRLRPGMFARVILSTGDPETVLSVDSQAVIRTGTRSVVIVAKDDSHFLPTEVRIGAELGGRTVILDGLIEGEDVVASGQFLIDSEASLKGVLARLGGRAMAPAGSAP